MELAERFSRYVREHNLFTQGNKLLLAVSGGVDSVVLCELCALCGFEFSIAHCNFQLRGEESERDEKFVRELSGKYQRAFYAARFETERIAAAKKQSIQETARALRYVWFEQIRASGGYSYIVTAHHADDNIETVLMNFFRGTGIRGLKGMEPKQHFLVRPLLFVRRAELFAFLQLRQLPFVSDSSNEKDDYTRNFFRHQVIPLIATVYPDANENVLGNITRLREAEQLYREAITLYKKKLLEHHDQEVHIPVLKLKKTPSLQTVLFEITRDFGFTAAQVTDIIHLLDSESGRFVQSSSHRAIKNRNWLIISPNQPAIAGTILIEKDVTEVTTPHFRLRISVNEAAAGKLNTSSDVAQLDAALVRFPLLLRKWKQGDYFYPLGMKKKKKLARFFIDQKLSRTDKEAAWVIEMDKKIIWVVGRRIDERFKMTGNTRQVLKIEAIRAQTV